MDEHLLPFRLKPLYRKWPSFRIYLRRKENLPKNDLKIIRVWLLWNDGPAGGV